MRITIGLSGASGLIYGIRMLEILKTVPEVETHLVLSQGAKMNIAIETQWALSDVLALADHVHPINDMAASIASGSFRTDGMIVAPCSMKTLSGIVHSYADNLLVRAADVVLKERRRLVLADLERDFLAMPYSEGDREFFIWGATAAMLRNFYRLLMA